MQPKYNAEELTTLNEAKELVQSNPQEAPLLLDAVIYQHLSEGKLSCALELRRIQCFAYMANLEYDETRNHLSLMVSEAKQAGLPRYNGISEMYLGVIAVECDDSEAAISHFGEAIHIATELEDLDLLCRVQTNLAYAQMRQERYEDALQTLSLCMRDFESDEESISNATIYYNIAITTIHLAFQEYVNDVLSEMRLNQMRLSLENAQQHCQGNAHLNLLTQVISAVYLGLTGSAQKGLAELSVLEQKIDRSSSSHYYSFMVAKCELLEIGGEYHELCRETNQFLDAMQKSSSFAYLQSTLRQSARAHANVGEFKVAYHHLLRASAQNIKRTIPEGGEQAKLISMQQDLERHKFDQEVLRMRNRTLIERNKILELEARYDPLSGLLNRRGTEEALQQFTDRRFATKFLIALLDIDHFKRVNDQYGHAIGDQVIHEFSACLTNSSTNPAKVGRWGGEEFLMVFDVSKKEDVALIGQTLVQEIRSLNWDHIHVGMKVTASVGLAVWSQGDSLDNAVRLADDMLYEVKQNGRNNWQAWPFEEAA